MSGQQIGSAVGFVAGFFLPGGPMVWSAIGGAIGGWISPTQVEGPRIGDGADQSSAEGQPIPWILGTCGWIQGNIVDKSEVREVKNTDDGKGSGVETVTFEAHQDFCIMICESSTVRNSLMVGVLIVQVDGKIVYDMRPESNFGADNAKFLENHTFYNGNDAQLPDPTMEALPHNGVGNTPYYRNVFTMVARDVNLTQYGERIPVYQFVMVGEGESEDIEETSYPSPVYSRFSNVGFPLLDPQEFYTLSGSRTRANGTATGSIPGDNIVELQTATNDVGYGPSPIDPNVYAGFYPLSETGTPELSQFITGFDITDDTTVWLAYQDRAWAGEVDGNQADPYALAVATPFDGNYYLGNDGWLYIVSTDFLPYHYPVGGTSPFPNRLNAIAPLVVEADRETFFVPPNPIPDAPGFYIDENGEVKPIPVYSVQAGLFLTLQSEQKGATPGVTQQYIKYQLGPVLIPSDPDNTEAFWTAAASAAGVSGTYPDDFPVPITSTLVGVSTIPGLATDTLGLDTALTRIVIRGGLTPDDIDVTEMDQQLLGYMITQNYIGTDCIRPLMTAFVSYASEYDAKIRFHKHGEDADLVIDAQDIIQGTEESDKNTREQQVEFPKTYAITYIDATQNYTARPQVDRRTSSDVRAIGEMQTQVPVVLPPDYARQLANIGMKVNWARAMGSREFSVPYAGYDTYLELVAGKPFGMDSQRRIASEISQEDGEIKIKGLYDRQSAYTSDIQATPALPPTPPPSNIGGVTLFAALNIGVIRDQDDTLGLQIAVAGLLQGWPGASLQWKLDTDSEWSTAIASMTQASTMGYLTAPLPLAPASGDDVTNTLSVSVQGGELNSITRFQYLNEQNPYAIVSNEMTGECELGQFQVAVETAPNQYDCTILTRGGLNTTPSAHTAGARFVYLDSVYFLPVPIAWIGRTIDLRPVTFGTIPDNNVSYSILFDPAVSQTEWKPGALTARISGSAFIASVTPRHRLGNDVTPIASINFIGYRWTLDDGDPTHAQSFDTVEPSAVFELSSFDSPATITVAELNRITGPGPTLSIIA